MQVLSGDDDGGDEELEARGRERPLAVGVLGVEQAVERDPAHHDLQHDDGRKTGHQKTAPIKRQPDEQDHVSQPLEMIYHQKLTGSLCVASTNFEQRSMTMLLRRPMAAGTSLRIAKRSSTEKA